MNDLRDISCAGVKLVAFFEGFQGTPYICAGGKKTIGYGHVIQDTEKNCFSEPLTKQEAHNLLIEDLKIYSQAIIQWVRVPLTQQEFDILTSFVYNVGEQNFKQSTLLKFLNKNNKNAASLQLPLWCHAAGRYLPGLFKRRIIEMCLFRGNPNIPEHPLKTLMTKNHTSLWTLYQELPERIRASIQEGYALYDAEPVSLSARRLSKILS